ncbi:hypothetical protein FA15DRAFT_661782, partial [Coprinopsis marcescibilis]
FLQKVFPEPDSRPDFICIDKACLVMRTVVSNPSWKDWLETSRFIVDSYHYNNHKASDELCQKWCNPAPEDGSQPNLVIVAQNAQGQPYLKQAFNTQVSYNFNWLIHVMLYYHSKMVLQKKKNINVIEVDDEDEEARVYDTDEEED